MDASQPSPIASNTKAEGKEGKQETERRVPRDLDDDGGGGGSSSSSSSSGPEDPSDYINDSDENGVTTSNGEQLPPVVSPPYWQHQRAASQVSAFSNGRPRPIILEDNTQEPEGVTSPLWARSVRIGSPTVVSGNFRGVGDYVVWTCSVETLDGGSMTIRKRYSEFETLRNQLIATFPNSKSSLPLLPPKSVFYKFRPAFLEKRRTGLEYFIKSDSL